MKHLWVNGDSHTAGTFEFDFVDNPFAKQVAQQLNMDYTNVAKPVGSNQQIIRTTVDALPDLNPQETVILLGWTSWERTEWAYNGLWYQICGAPNQHIPEFIQYRWQENQEYFHKHFVEKSAADEIWRCAKEQEHSIWVFHRLLHNLGYKFLFFLGCSYPFFLDQDRYGSSRLSWIPGTWAHDPYAKEGFSYYAEQNHCPKDSFGNYGQLAHNKWAEFILPQIKSKI